MTGIYAIHNKINDKYYIGQAIDINERWIQHRSRLKCKTHENKHLQSAYNKYSKDAFEYFIVEECSTEQLDEKEIYYVALCHAYTDGYNQDIGGAGCKGYKHTEEEISKMRMVQKPKSVLQLDMELNIVGEWVSCSHAGKTLGLSARSIKAVCNRVNHQKTIGGFYWIYKEEYDNNAVDWDYYLNINASKPKRVSQYSLDMKLIKIYDSIYQAGITSGYNASEISSVCNHKKRTYKKYIWRFTDDYTEEEYLKDCQVDYTKRPSVGAKRLFRYDLEGNLLCIYSSLRDAVEKTHFSRSSIQQCLYGKIKSSHGSIWKYDERIIQ